MLKFLDKYFKAVTIKVLQQAIVNTTERHFKKEKI